MGFRWFLLITINVCEKFDHYELIVDRIGVNGKKEIDRSKHFVTTYLT